MLINPKSIIFVENDQINLPSLREIATDEFHPIVVSQTENGTFIMIDGHNRATVALERNESLEAAAALVQQFLGSDLRARGEEVYDLLMSNI